MGPSRLRSEPLSLTTPSSGNHSLPSSFSSIISIAMASAAPAPEASWATADEAAQALVMVLRPGYLVALFVAGWAANVAVFNFFGIDYGTVLGLSREEQISPYGLSLVVLAISTVLGLVRMLAQLQGVTSGLLTTVLLLYSLSLCMLGISLPSSLARWAKWRIPMGRALLRSFWPDPMKEVPFVEVLVADGLTSLAKVFFDLMLSACVLVGSAETLDPFGISEAIGLSGGTSSGSSASAGSPDNTRVSSAFGECNRSCLPFFAWALPFLLRARQCYITAKLAPDAISQTLQYINLLKYLSAMPVILFAFLHSHGVGGSESAWSAEDFEVLWALAAVVNSVFSFVWDMVMDWGLLNPAPWRTVHFGLRPVLLLRHVWGFYHIAIVLNLLGRTLWSLRWSPDAKLILGGFFLTSFQQAAEVVRRCLWCVIRVEWECVRKNVQVLKTNKLFPV